MADRKSPKSEPAPRPRSGAPVQAFIDPEVRAAMDAFISDYNSSHDHKAGVTSTIEAALKRYLTEAGFWPPKSKGK